MASDGTERIIRSSNNRPTGREVISQEELAPEKVDLNRLPPNISPPIEDSGVNHYVKLKV